MIMMARKKQTYWQFVGGFVDGVVSKPAVGLVKSRKVAMKSKVKGTRLKKVLLAKGKKKKDWVDKLLGRKATKTEKVVIKGTVYGAGALALIGAGGEVAKRFGK